MGLCGSDGPTRQSAKVGVALIDRLLAVGEVSVDEVTTIATTVPRQTQRC